MPPALPWTRATARVIATEAVGGREAPGPSTRPAAGRPRLDEAWAGLVGALVPPLGGAAPGDPRPGPAGCAAASGARGAAPLGAAAHGRGCAPEVWATAQLAQLLGAVSDAGVIAGLRAARARWSRLCLVHGDLKHDNVLVCGAGGDRLVVLVDWEMARLGDPAWDLAALAARLHGGPGRRPLDRGRRRRRRAADRGLCRGERAAGAGAGPAAGALLRGLLLMTPAAPLDPAARQPRDRGV